MGSSETSLSGVAHGGLLDDRSSSDGDGGVRGGGQQDAQGGPAEPPLHRSLEREHDPEDSGGEGQGRRGAEGEAARGDRGEEEEEGAARRGGQEEEGGEQGQALALRERRERDQRRREREKRRGGKEGRMSRKTVVQND